MARGTTGYTTQLITPAVEAIYIILRTMIILGKGGGVPSLIIKNYLFFSFLSFLLYIIIYFLLVLWHPFYLL